MTGPGHAPENPVPVLYLALDGAVRPAKNDSAGGHAVRDVFPEAVTMMRRWKNQGGRIIGVSDQAGIALGQVTAEDAEQAMMRTYRDTDGLFDKIAYCPHHPDATEPHLARCWCRKPAPGLLIESALTVGRHYGEYYPPHLGLMVGDRPEDEQCAHLAGLDFQWAAEWRAQAGDNHG